MSIRVRLLLVLVATAPLPACLQRQEEVVIYDALPAVVVIPSVVR